MAQSARRQKTRKRGNVSLVFIRWRGNSAELLTTVYEHGRSRQLRLACFGPLHYVAPEVQAEVTARFPGVTVDWPAVEEALAAGPPTAHAQQAAGVPDDRLEWLHLERRLCYWAALTAPLRPREADRLRAAAAVLGEWRQGRPAFAMAEPPPGWDPEQPAPRPELAPSSGDT